MEKVLIWAGIAAVLCSLSGKNNSSIVEEPGNALKPNATLNGKAVKTATGTKLYLISNGMKVEFLSQAAYINFGSPEIVILTDTALNQLPEVTNKKVYDDGKIRQVQ